MRRYIRHDPYWLNAKYAGKCGECGEGIKPGDRIFYYPPHWGEPATVLCESCGARGAADLAEAKLLERDQNW